MSNIGKLPKDVWEAARFIWENTMSISDRELVEELQTHFTDDAPKSGGTISKRRNKEGWKKSKIAKQWNQDEVKTQSRVESGAKKRNHSAKSKKVIPSKGNRAEKLESVGYLESRGKQLETIADSIVLNAKDRNRIINKHRARYDSAGLLSEKSLDLLIKLFDMVDDNDSDPELLQKALVVSDSSSQILERIVKSLKVLSEVELPLCGIGPEDFQQSEQERRLGALDKLKGISEKEKLARDTKKPRLAERLAEIRQMESSIDFNAEPVSDDEVIDDVDYTLVDDD